MVTAKFLEGSVLRHIAVMTGTTSVGMLFLFVVDLVDLYFLSLLNDVEITAAIGFASAVLFFTGAVSIGLAVSMGAMVSRAIGAGERDRARRYVVHVGLFALAVSLLVATLLWLAVPDVLALIGAGGRTGALAAGYLRIVIPTMPVFAVGISAASVLRAVGAARLAMLGTLGGGIVNAVLDPVFIFGFDMGIAGAAWASVAARVAVLAIGAYGVAAQMRMLGVLEPARLGPDVVRIAGIAGPAMLANIATPFGNAYVTASMADFGDHAVAGYTIISRIIPVAFGIILGLSGGVGPVIGQNFGARNFARVRRALGDALLLSTVAVLSAWILLAALQQPIAALFGASEAAGGIWRFYASYLAVFYVFTGAQFIANAAFNNLGRPLWSAFSNWGRATLGTVPFVWLGAAWLGPNGVLIGHAAGGVVFGAGAFLVAWWLSNAIAPGPANPAGGAVPGR